MTDSTISVSLFQWHVPDLAKPDRFKLILTFLEKEEHRKDALDKRLLANHWCEAISRRPDVSMHFRRLLCMCTSFTWIHRTVEKVWNVVCRKVSDESCGLCTAWWTGGEQRIRTQLSEIVEARHVMCDRRDLPESQIEQSGEQN